MTIVSKKGATARVTGKSEFPQGVTRKEKVRNRHGVRTGKERETERREKEARRGIGRAKQEEKGKDSFTELKARHQRSKV